jgi:hypothetical protein
VSQGLPDNFAVDFRTGLLEASSLLATAPIRAEIVVGPEIRFSSVDVAQWASAIPLPIKTDLTSPGWRGLGSSRAADHLGDSRQWQGHCARARRDRLDARGRTLGPDDPIHSDSAIRGSAAAYASGRGTVLCQVAWRP